jgi:hypothetical protein
MKDEVNSIKWEGQHCVMAGAISHSNVFCVPLLFYTFIKVPQILTITSAQS